MPFLRKTDKRVLEDILGGADIFLGLSVGNIVKPEMLQGMAKDPIIFALANPTPEISYMDAKKARPDAIVATGRSDFPNQVNNVLGFPFIFTKGFGISFVIGRNLSPFPPHNIIASGQAVSLLLIG